MIIRILSMLVLFFFLSFGSCYAGPDCKYYFKADQKKPALINELIVNLNAYGIEECIVGDAPEQQKILYKLTKVKKGYQDICYYRAYQLFEVEDKGSWRMKPRVGVEFLDSIVMRMALSKQECPKQDSSSYVLSKGVSEGVFLIVHQFIEKLKVKNAKTVKALMDTNIINSQYDKYFLEFIKKNKKNLFLSRITFEQHAQKFPPHFIAFVSNGKKEWGMMLDVNSQTIQIITVLQITK